MRPTLVRRPNRSDFYYPQTFITGKGLAWIQTQWFDGKRIPRQNVSYYRTVGRDNGEFASFDATTLRKIARALMQRGRSLG